VRLSDELGISRTAIWKRIRRLEAEGYVVASAPRLGYKLLRGPERYRMDELLKRMEHTGFGSGIKLLDLVDSTQNAAHEAPLDGAGEGTVILAEGQTSGRG